MNKDIEAATQSLMYRAIRESKFSPSHRELLSDYFRGLVQEVEELRGEHKDIIIQDLSTNEDIKEGRMRINLKIRAGLLTDITLEGIKDLKTFVDKQTDNEG